ncbi:MAG TPA: hypothetical protein VF384_03160 [Planctomycetota bacterium]
MLVVAHFKEALLKAGHQLAAVGIAFQTKTSWTAADTRELLASPPRTVLAVLAKTLPVDREESDDRASRADGPIISLRVFDLHVLAEENERILRFANGLPVPTRIAASVSFEDPHMAVFAKPWVKTMMATMGMKADEPIDSPMVSSGLARALKKLAKKATGNMPSDSMQEWMKRNLRE